MTVKGKTSVFNLSDKSRQFRKYNRFRPTKDLQHFCHAPFKNIYFNIHGAAAPCWQSFTVDNNYPEKTINGIWSGEHFEEIREGIRSSKLSIKCEACYNKFIKGNYRSVLARAYDNNYPKSDYPTMMELELGNICNLECIMCNGHLSSSIAKNREKREPTKSPYDEGFIEQIEEFLPYLKEVRINGGEPFLNEINYHFLEKLLEINPKVNIVIATNGTILNKRIKSLLERGYFNVNLSIDSLDKELYEKIRLNGTFEDVMNNLNYFLDYCNKRKTTLCILTNPMPQNWTEMPSFVKFCNSRNIPIWFNTIIKPDSCSLSQLDSSELTNIFRTLTKHKFIFSMIKPQSYHNIKIFNNLVYKQIKGWIHEAIEREKALQYPQILLNSLTNYEKDFYSSLLAYMQSLKLSKEKAYNRFEEIKKK